MNYTYHFTRGPIGPADFPKCPVSVHRYDRGYMTTGSSVKRGALWCTTDPYSGKNWRSSDCWKTLL